VRRLTTILAAAIVFVLLAVGIWFLFQPDVPIKPFATAPRTSSIVPDAVPPFEMIAAITTPEAIFRSAATGKIERIERRRGCDRTLERDTTAPWMPLPPWSSICRTKPPPPVLPRGWRGAPGKGT
jgi:hypothetical protein